MNPYQILATDSFRLNIIVLYVSFQFPMPCSLLPALAER